MAETDNSGVMSLTVTLLSAYFANNTVPSSELPALVEGTRRALLGDTPEAPGKSADDTGGAASSTAPALVTEPVAPEAPPATHKPAVSIEESLASPDQILSLIDGKPYKALKRHLSTHGLTPADYRARYGLPADYPLVAPSYSAARREVAQKFGLGGKRKSAPAPAPAAEEAPATPTTKAVEPPAAEAAAAKPAAARRARTKAVTTGAKPVANAPKNTTSKSAKPIKDGKTTKATKTSKAPKAAVATTPAASADATPKPKRSRAPKASAGTPASAELAPEAAAPAE